MIKTQVQIPDQLYYKAKAIAEQREWSFAEVIRRGLEHMARAYPVTDATTGWKLPVLKSDVFVSHFDRLDFKALSDSEEVRDVK
jgi:hypothetical protein